MHRAGRQVEGVRVPLEHVLAAVEVPAQAVRLRGRRRMQAVPADLAHIVRPHTGAERRGQKLRAEADAEDRDVEPQRFPDRRDLGGQVRVFVGLVHVHGPAQHDQSVVAAHVRLLRRIAREVDVANPESRFSEHRIQQAERFAGRVLEDEELAHAGRPT
jgi:hypothetical protein